MKLVILTKPTFFVEEDKILTTLFEEGMEDLHLYKPDSSPMYSERLLSLLPDEYYRKITVHEHYYLKAEYGLNKIHIDYPAAEPPKDYKGKFSRTCTDISQIKDFRKKSEYVFLENNTPDMQVLKEAARSGLVDKRVYAIGNINIDNIRQVRELGYGGAVVGGDLWNRFDIHNEIDYKRLIQHFEKLKKAIS